LSTLYSALPLNWSCVHARITICWLLACLFCRWFKCRCQRELSSRTRSLRESRKVI